MTVVFFVGMENVLEVRDRNKTKSQRKEAIQDKPIGAFLPVHPMKKSPALPATPEKQGICNYKHQSLGVP